MIDEESEAIIRAVAQSKSIYERVKAVRKIVEDARRAALEEAIGYCDGRARRCRADGDMPNHVAAYELAADGIRALLDDANSK